MLMISGPSGVTRPARVERPRKAADAADHGVEPVSPSEDAPATPKYGRRATDAPTPEARPTASPEPAAPRSYAPLVAQLIAGKLGVPQTRQRRRGPVADAITAYRRTRRAVARAPHGFETKA
ncbi:hypothetical protein [Methylopila turkensis]|uniref:Uncharacterized protein n=1 Tax=Methylopila turkensis TaxID=1437816 RepID=A0A9W6N666_9HYPH|nr:hypothetical protein [Methylopila turkensis]GLK79914.1 hypothetical protein GCM10008174_16550 [Methylopila turkensis]